MRDQCGRWCDWQPARRHLRPNERCLSRVDAPCLGRHLSLTVVRRRSLSDVSIPGCDTCNRHHFGTAVLPRTVMTTFPRARPSFRYLIALGTSLSGYVLSTTGLTLPASMRSFRNSRSWVFAAPLTGRSRWLTKGDTTSARRTTQG